MIVALHAATGATMGAAVRSRTAAALLGIPLHLAGDRVPHRDTHNRSFEIGSGLAIVGLVAARRGLADAATVGALAACAPDLEHLFRLPRPGGSKLFHGRRGWHRSGPFSAPAQLLLAGVLTGGCSRLGNLVAARPMRTRRHPNERFLVLASFGLASALCVAFELFREDRYGALGFRFLLWNLVLAWVPLLIALVVYDLYRRGTRPALLTPAIALWLLFLPNAPYLVTDFIHLTPGAQTPLWLDGVILSAFAWTGVLLGFVSLYLMHAVARDRLGPAGGWTAALAALALTSAGVYLGRFLQWNSWDLITRPGQRLAEVAPRLDQTNVLAHAAGVTLLLTALLVSTYLAFYTLVGLTVDPERST